MRSNSEERILFTGSLSFSDPQTHYVTFYKLENNVQLVSDRVFFS